MKQKFSFEPRWFAVIIFFLLGAFLGGLMLFIWIFNGGTVYGIKKVHPNNSSYKFINPLLAINLDQPIQFLQNDVLKSQISSVIAKAQKNNQVSMASLYFQDLESGRWFGIKEDNKYSPGKFLKVPIMIAYFKAAETKPEVLKKTLVYHNLPDDSNSGNQVDLQEGESYTVEEIIKDMIIDDSDSSAVLLFDNMDKTYLNEVYSDLGVDYHEDRVTDDYISTKLSSLFYRVLYNATYLNREDSEKALNIISQGDIGQGVDKILPNEVVIAHRVRNRAQNNQLKEISDCGIIYYPAHPYILCALANGKNQDNLDSFISETSQVVYQDMSERYKNNN